MAGIQQSGHQIENVLSIGVTEPERTQTKIDKFPFEKEWAQQSK